LFAVRAALSAGSAAGRRGALECGLAEGGISLLVRSANL